MSSGNGFFIFHFCCCLVRCLGRCLGGLVLPSPFLARYRPRCLVDGCLGAIGAVGAAEDLVVAEPRPNMRNKSSIFRYRGAYLAYRSSTVRKFLTTLYSGGGGEIVRYFGGGDGDGSSDSGSDGVSDVGGDTLFSSGRAAGDGIRGVSGGGGEDERCLCSCFWHSSRRW